MSDPAKTAEIEDVLSSIRRLVSEEGRLEARASSAATVRPGKLVLTPALRVADREEDEPRATAAPERENRTADADDRARVAPWTNPEATLYAAAEAAGAELDERSETEDPAGFVQKTMAEELPDAPTDDLLDAGPEESLSAKIEVVEAVIAQTDDDWEPDGLSEDAYSGTRGATMEWQDHVAQDAGSDPVGGDAASFDSDPLDYRDEGLEPGEQDIVDERSILSPEDGYLDEESLRELVADIVREELQGALGERITRNVRKLVRREIHRALTAQEFE